MKDVFSKFARSVSNALGTPLAFALAFLVVIAWAASGPFFHFSETWQLVINTGTTIITFLMVFLIQSTQNRDSKAVHLKLDELVYVIAKARNQLIDCEELSDRELLTLEEEFRQLREVAQASQPTPAPSSRKKLKQLVMAKRASKH